MQQINELCATIIESLIFELGIIYVVGPLKTKKASFLFRILGWAFIFTLVVSLGNIYFSISLIAVYFYYLTAIILTCIFFRAKLILSLVSVSICFLICHSLDLSINLLFGLINGSNNLISSFWAVLDPGINRLLFILFAHLLKVIVIISFSFLLKGVKDFPSQALISIFILFFFSHCILLLTNQFLLDSSPILQHLAIIIEEISILSISIMVLSMMIRSYKYNNLQKKYDQIALINQIIYKAQIRQSNTLDHEYKATHEYRHHLKSLLGRKDIGPESIQYISSLLEQSKLQRNISAATGDSFVDAVINGFSQEFAEAKIDFRYSSTLAEPLPFSPIDICSLCSNLIENAIDACMLIPESERRWINFSITRHNQIFTIRVDNSISPSHSVLSKHPSRRSYGIEIIKSIVASYDGSYYTEYNNNTYLATLILQHEE